MKRKIIAFAAIMVLSPILFAQEGVKSLPGDTINLDEIVVTGTAVKVNRHNVPMAVSVIGSRQINESIETAILPVLNGRIPGLFVTERGVMGFGVSSVAAGQISIRGIGGNPTTGVLILIDGHPQFMGIFGHPLPDSYVASDVEKVEVIRGPASILYGSNAMGGVINIITKQQREEGLHGNAHIMYGSYNTLKCMVSSGYKKEKFSTFISVNHDQTDGHRANSDFNITNGYIKVGYEPLKGLNIYSDFSVAKFKASDPGPDTLDALPGNSLDITRGYWALTANNSLGKFSGTAKLFYNFGEHIISDGFHSNDNNYGINFYETARLFPNNNLTIGSDYLIYGGRAENEKSGIFITDTTVYDAGIFGFIQQTFAKTFTINAGLRLQMHKIYGTRWIPSGGFAWKLLDNTTWKASVSKGFRSPTIRELFFWNHNINLEPETVMNYETGFLQSFPCIKANLELTGFIVRGDNLIITVPMKGLQNAGEVRNNGIEFAAGANLSDKLTLNLTYSYNHMKTPIYATPKHNLFGSVNFKLEKFQFMISAQYINHLDVDPAFDKESFETYTLLNSKVSYKIFRFADIFLSAENIFNEKYATNIYYTMPGITLFAGLKLSL
ncbi:MAG: TonB-dependent receptor [Bacteroidales bacterium]|nr:TonB-dependent receptor [Bacteroidales bacterium]